AQVPGKLDPDPARVRLRESPHDVARRDQHARRAEPALQTMLTREGRAQVLHDGIVLESFDRLHRKTVGLNHIGDAGARRLVVDQHGASAADAVFEAEMGPRTPAPLPQESGEMGARLARALDLPPVHAERDRHHGANPSIKARVPAATAMPRSTASRLPIACVSAWLIASVEVALCPCFATASANDVSG